MEKHQESEKLIFIVQCCMLNTGVIPLFPVSNAASVQKKKAKRQMFSFYAVVCVF